MAHNLQLSYAACNAEADALASLANGGKLVFYAGSMPAGADEALGEAVQLAELTLADPAFGPAVNGIITSYPIAADTSADATGTATFFRVYQADGTTCLIQGTVGTSDCDLIMNSVGFSAGAQVSVALLVYAVSRGLP